jgi:25S rRNA (adenine2142-N1)-methyltransferase
MKNKRKRPLSSTAAPVVSNKVTQATISAYHTLSKRRTHLKKICSARNDIASMAELAEVEAKLASAGGIDAYQKASQLGQSAERGGDSSKVLIGWLKERRGAGRLR